MLSVLSCMYLMQISNQVLAHILRHLFYVGTYPIDFIRQILKMYKNSLTPRQVYEEYQRILEHYHHDV